MATNTSPVFTITPVIGVATIGTANTGRDGSGTIGTVITGATYGTRIDQITIKAVVTTTAGTIRLYIGDDAGTPAISLWREIIVTAITASATLPAFEYIMSLTGESALVLPPNYTLRASTEKAESFKVIAKGGSY